MASSNLQVKAVSAIALTVQDASLSSQFFCQALGFEQQSDEVWSGSELSYLVGVADAKVRSIHLSLGSESIRLMEFLAQESQPIPEDAQANDRWFQHFAVIVSDMDAAYGQFKAAAANFAWEPTSPEPQTLPAEKDGEGIRAYKFRGPDRHNLELLWFPGGEGRDKWHRLSQQQAPGDSPFLGIDHSAISIADTERSLAFYCDGLGFELSAQQLNQGIEQETMDGLFAAKARVSSLDSSGGEPIGVEFLHYLTPAGGRSRPRTWRCCDLPHLHYEMRVEKIEAMVAQLEAAKAQFISPMIVDIRGLGIGGDRACMVQDPDGHAVMLIEG